MSSAHHRVAEPFRVVDSGGNITQERQVVNNMPSLKDTRPPKYLPPTRLPVLARDRNVYY